MNPQEMALAAGMDQLFKASTGGPLFGSQTIGQPVTPGSYNGLLIADLEPMIIHTYQTEADYQAMAVIPKQRAITRNPEFVVDVAQGTRRSTGVLEGQAFGYQYNGAYDRKTTPLKTNLINVSATYQVMENLLMPNYKGDTSGELAALKSEIYQGTLSLMESLNRQLFKGNASILPLEFDGLEALQQEYFGGLAAYQSSDFVVDARGSALTPTILSNAQTRINTLGFAHTSSVGVIGKYTVFDRYIQNLLSSGLVQNNNFMNFKYDKAVNNYGIQQTGFVTPSGEVKFIRDRFTGRRDHILTSTAGQEGTQAAPAGLSYAAGAGTGSQFATADAGIYFYAIEAVSASGVSVATLVSGTAVTVAANQIVDITVGTPAAGATGYRVYRSRVNPTTAGNVTPLFPILEVSAAQLTAGFDGGAAGVIRDKNRFIAGTEDVYMIEMEERTVAYRYMDKQMHSVTFPAGVNNFLGIQTALLAYSAVQLKSPKRMVKIQNVGVSLI